MSEIGTIVQVRRVPGGSGLAAAVNPGDLSLTVDWAIDFTPGERRLLMIGSDSGDNETLAYTAVDDDTETLTIEPPGVVLPWDAGDPVSPLDATGSEPEETWTIEVDMGDGGDPMPCRPSHALQDKLREDEEYAGVRCEVADGEVVTLLDKTASIQPGALTAPRFVGYLNVNQSIPTGTGFTDVSGWVVQQLKGGMVYDGIASIQVPLDGSYSISGAVMWEINGTGRRSVQPAYDTSIGPFPGGLMNLAADGSARQTTPVVTPYKEALAGEWIKLTVSQTSGGALDLVGDALATKSFFCVKYEGPL